MWHKLFGKKLSAEENIQLLALNLGATLDNLTVEEFDNAMQILYDNGEMCFPHWNKEKYNRYFEGALNLVLYRLIVQSGIARLMHTQIVGAVSEFENYHNV